MRCTMWLHTIGVMQKIIRLILEFGSLVFVLLLSPILASAAGQAPKLTAPNGLSIAEIKITGSEFVVLQNNTAATIPDLGSYWLYAFNKTDPSAAGASSSGQQLPLGQLDPGQTLLLSSDARATCGAEIAGNLSLSFGDSAGYLEVMKQTVVNGALTQTPGDTVSWSSGTTGVIQKVPSNTNTSYTAPMYYRTTETTNGWQLANVDSKNTCQLNAVITLPADPQPPVSSLVQPSTQPPSSIIGVTATQDDISTTATLPTADIGLAAPQITELLPNPIGTDNDDTDEYIELYNSNAASFDLSGFVLQTGTTTKHNYTFPAGTTLSAKSFVAFYSADTGLSLSNSSGQADLLDPMGNVIGQTDAYGAAKDGQSWALAKGTWYWTTELTPSAANIIKLPVAATKSKAKTTAKKSTASVKGASTAKTSKAAKSSGTSATTTGGTADTAATVTPIHPWTLAVVALLAVAYGIYEYRLDLANRFYQLRKHRATGRTAG